MAQVIAVANQKGGVGKTTTGVNLAACFAAMKKRTLLIGLDPQANEVTCCGVDLPEGYKSTYDVLHGTPAQEAIVQTAFGFDLLPASRDLAAFESDVSEVIAPDMEYTLFLREGLGQSGVFDAYDIILLDFPPSLGALANNGLAAANQVLIPLQPEVLATEGTQQLLETVSQVKTKVNPSLAFAGAFMTMYNHNLSLNRFVRREAEKFFKDANVPFLNTVIKRSVRFGEAPGYGQPAVICFSDVPAVQDYHRLAKEVVRA